MIAKATRLLKVAISFFRRDIAITPENPEEGEGKAHACDNTWFRQFAVTSAPAIGVQCGHELARGCFCSGCRFSAGPLQYAKGLNPAICGAYTVVRDRPRRRGCSSFAGGSAFRDSVQFDGDVHGCCRSLHFQPEP